MRVKLDIVINGMYHLYLPAEGIDISLKQNEFDLLTTNKAESRPLYITENFEIPIDMNDKIFAELEGQEKKCELIYNDIVLISGYIIEYSSDNQTRLISISIVSSFKEMVDYMGDNVLYLDKVDLEDCSYIVGEFSSKNDTDIVKFGYYNPMDTDTGQLVFDASNVNAYCKPSMNVINYMKRVFDANRWSAQWEHLPKDVESLCITPTVPYRCSSFVAGQDNINIKIPPKSKYYLDLGISNTIFNNYNTVSHEYGASYVDNNVIFPYMIDITSANRNTIIENNRQRLRAINPSVRYSAFNDRIEGSYGHKFSGKSFYLIGYMNSSLDSIIGLSMWINTNVRIYGFQNKAIELKGGKCNYFKIKGVFTNIDIANIKNIGIYLEVVNGNTIIEGYGFNCVIDDPSTSIQIRQPNRLQSFKLKMLYDCPDPLNVVISEKDKDNLIEVQSLGDSVLNQTTDSINTKEGLNPLSIYIENPNNSEVSIKFKKWRFYNLFNIYETNQDVYISPLGYYFSFVDNLPSITILDLYRELLILFQIAQRVNDITRNVDFYQINNIFSKQQEIVDLQKYIYWNGYETIGAPEGLNKINIIRYKDDTRRQQYFRIDLPQLPANGVYFESLFAHSETNNAWGAMTLPALKYKVKLRDNVSVEYLDWSDIKPSLGVYTPPVDSSVLTPILFNPITISNIVRKYWRNIIQFMSSSSMQNPNVFKAKVRVSYYEYKRLMSQGNLFFYNGDAIMIDSEYNVIDHTLTGTFINLK